MVWGCLVASMTVASGLLLWLEPQPLLNTRASLTLSAIDAGPVGINAVFNVPNLQRHHWTQIIIHHSGKLDGNAASIGKLHQDLDYGELQYHFVINNGRGAPDGQIQVGPLWQRQADDVYAPASISICLVGNGDQTPPTIAQMQQLVRLITAIQEQLRIPASGVRLHSELAPTTSPGRFFPVSQLRPYLLTSVTQ